VMVATCTHTFFIRSAMYISSSSCRDGCKSGPFCFIYDKEHRSSWALLVARSSSPTVLSLELLSYLLFIIYYFTYFLYFLKSYLLMSLMRRHLRVVVKQRHSGQSSFRSLCVIYHCDLSVPIKPSLNTYSFLTLSQARDGAGVPIFAHLREPLFVPESR
jgi:hypothetical protein